MKCMINKYKKSLITFLLVLCSLVAVSTVYGGGYDIEKNQQPTTVEVTLHAVNRFEAVQLFDFLLGKTQGVISAEQTGVRLLNDDPDACSAGWSLKIEHGQTENVVTSLMATINALDPSKQNDILYDAPFIVMEEDLEMIKKVIPVELSTEHILFSPEDRVNEHTLTDHAFVKDLSLPWYKQPGAGFE